MWCFVTAALADQYKWFFHFQAVGEKKNQRMLFCNVKIIRFHISLLIKFYWNTVKLLHLYIAYDCFCTAVAELSICNRVYDLKYFTLQPFTEKVSQCEITFVSQSITPYSVDAPQEGQSLTIFHLSLSCSSVSCFSSKN